MTNEGTGVALDVTAGVIRNGERFAFGEGDGYRFRTVGPGEQVPPMPPSPPPPEGGSVENVLDHIRKSAPPTIEAIVPLDPGIDDLTSLVYWCRYTGLLGERWETLSPEDAQQPQTTRMLVENQ